MYPVGLNLEYLWLNRDIEFQKNLAAVLLKSTGVIIGPDSMFKLYFEKPDGEDLESIRVIQYCSLRNKLMLEYPEFAHLIKKISKDAGLYNPGGDRNPALPTLKSLAAHTLLGQNTQTSRLPAELIGYLNELQAIEQKLDKEIGKPRQKP